MSWIEGATLGLLQGLTEFLPVSSSGHLALARSLLGYHPDSGALLEILLHLGTALSIMTVFARDLVPLVRAGTLLVAPHRWRSAWKKDAAFRTVVLVLVSAVPAGVVGLLFRHEVEALFDRPRVVGALLLTTGLMLALLRAVPRGERPVRLRTAVVMGMAQAAAVLPGISRSGATIAAGLVEGADRAAVGRFAFLMALVPILGAALLEVPELGTAGAPPLGPVLAGTLVAFLSGILALKLLLRFVVHGRLAAFAPYCLIVGAVAILW